MSHAWRVIKRKLTSSSAEDRRRNALLARQDIKALANATGHNDGNGIGFAPCEGRRTWL